MGLNDISGVFSHYFIVGFFLPSFFVLVALKLALSSAFLPAVVEPDRTGSFLVIGGVSVLIGLLLIGLNFPIVRLLEGYPLMEPSPRRFAGVRRWLKLHLVGRQQARFDELVAMKKEGGLSRRIGTWRLDIWFPTKREDVLPTSLGNRIRAFEVYGERRWGLSSIAAWPRIEMLLSEPEEKLYLDAQGDFLFFANGSVGAFVAGLVLGVDGAVNHPHPWWLVWIYALPFVLSYLLYTGSLGAAERWGDAVRSAVDLHRLDLYTTLGLKVPGTFAEERQLGEAVTNLLYWGTAVPDRFKAQSQDSLSSPAGPDEG